MAENRITAPDDVVTYLKNQHVAIKALFGETLAASDTATQQAAFTRLRTLLAVHETAEEMMVHPRVQRKISGGVMVADARLAEEHDTRSALAALERIPCGTAEFHAQLTALQASVTAHANREEAEEFTLLTEQLGADELLRMTAAVRVAESIAPTHPDSRAQPGTAAFAVGPFAALLERARDALRGRAE